MTISTLELIFYSACVRNVRAGVCYVQCARGWHLAEWHPLGGVWSVFPLYLKNRTSGTSSSVARGENAREKGRLKIELHTHASLSLKPDNLEAMEVSQAEIKARTRHQILARKRLVTAGDN